MSVLDEFGLNCAGKCTGACCKVMFLPIDNGEKMRWAWLHGIRIFRIRETGEFRMLFEKKCGELNSENRCSIYAKRPELCRAYECGQSGTYEEYVFENEIPVPKI